MPPHKILINYKGGKGWLHRREAWHSPPNQMMIYQHGTWWHHPLLQDTLKTQLHSVVSLPEMHTLTLTTRNTWHPNGEASWNTTDPRPSNRSKLGSCSRPRRIRRCVDWRPCLTLGWITKGHHWGNRSHLNGLCGRTVAGVHVTFLSGQVVLRESFLVVGNTLNFWEASGQQLTCKQFLKKVLCAFLATFLCLILYQK